MIGWLLGRVGCMRGMHERSLPHVRRTGATYESRCCFCGTPIVRLAKRRWAIKPD